MSGKWGQQGHSAGAVKESAQLVAGRKRGDTLRSILREFGLDPLNDRHTYEQLLRFGWDENLRVDPTEAGKQPYKNQKSMDSALRIFLGGETTGMNRVTMNVWTGAIRRLIAAKQVEIVADDVVIHADTNGVAPEPMIEQDDAPPRLIAQAASESELLEVLGSNLSPETKLLITRQLLEAAK